MMRRLSVRLVLSHLAVALLATATTYAVVRWWAPALFDQSLHGPGVGAGSAGGAGQGAGLRRQFAAAVNRAVLTGGLLGVAAAALLSVHLSRRIAVPLQRLGGATRAIATGDYDVDLPEASTVEIADLGRDIQGLAEQLADTEARRVRLLGEMAHEMRTPLTVANGTVEAMIDGVMPADAEHLGLVQVELRRVARLGSDLSALSRAEEGRLELVLRPVRLDGVAQDVVNRLLPQAEDAGVELVVKSEPTVVVADPDRLAQVVTNLVGNALQATGAGGGVTVTCTASREALLAVTDTGVGLDGDEVGRVFERFYRGATPRADGGTGIGLTIARGIVEAHGGTLTATSPGRGRGATFSVRLPLAELSGGRST